MNQVLQVPFVDLAAQYAAIEDQVGEAMARVLRKTNFILGQEVDLFEKDGWGNLVAGIRTGLERRKMICAPFH